MSQSTNVYYNTDNVCINTQNLGKKIQVYVEGEDFKREDLTSYVNEVRNGLRNFSSFMWKTFGLDMGFKNDNIVKVENKDGDNIVMYRFNGISLGANLEDLDITKFFSLIVQRLQLDLPVPVIKMCKYLFAEHVYLAMSEAGDKSADQLLVDKYCKNLYVINSSDISYLLDDFNKNFSKTSKLNTSVK